MSQTPAPANLTRCGRIGVELTTEWKQYAVDLIGQDLSCIKTGFGWSLRGADKPVTVYLDDIRYE